jgi:flagellar protein FlaG
MMIVENSLIRSLESGLVSAGAPTRLPGESDIHVLPVKGNEPGDIQDTGKLEEAIKEINEFIKQASPSIQFSVDKESGRTIVKMIDIENNQLIRQIPTKEALAISRALDSLKGMTVHLKA